MTKWNIAAVIVGAFVTMNVLNILLFSTYFKTYVIYPLIGAAIGEAFYLLLRKARKPPDTNEAAPLGMDELKSRGIADER